MLEIVCRAFEIDRKAAEHIFYADPFFDPSHKWLLYAGKRPVATATIVPLSINLGYRSVPCAGIAGVATDPPEQGKGYATMLLSELLVELPRMGFEAAVLVPRTKSIYERLGFVTVGERWSQTFRFPTGPKNTLQIAKHPDHHNIRWADESTRHEVQRLHRLHAAHRIGAVVRDERRWNYFFWHNRRIALLGQPARQYLVLSREPQGIVVKELVPSTPTHLVRNLLSEQSFSVIGTACDLEGWCKAGCLAESDPLHEEHFMARVVDAAKVLSALASRAPHASLDIEVDDRLLSCNCGTWKIHRGHAVKIRGKNRSGTEVNRRAGDLDLGPMTKPPYMVLGEEPDDRRQEFGEGQAGNASGTRRVPVHADEPLDSVEMRSTHSQKIDLGVERLTEMVFKGITLRARYCSEEDTELSAGTSGLFPATRSVILYPCDYF